MNLEDIYRLLRNNHAEAVGIVDTLPTPLLVLDRDLRVVNGSRAFFGTFQVSRDETIGQFIYDLGNHQWDIPELRLLLEEVIPRSATGTGFEVTHKFPGLGERTMLVSAQRVFHPDNTATTLLVSIEDATERRRIDAERDMLESELRHRMKNSLAVIHALAAQTAVEGRSAAEYRDSFLRRLKSLINAYDLGSAEEPLDLGALINGVLEPYAETPGRLVVEGTLQVPVPPPQVLPLHLVLHELATNAVKYGSLSRSQGTLHVSWSVEAGGRQVALHWKERGGPAVRVPTNKGFGTRLLRFAAERELGGDLETKFGREGLDVTLRFPRPMEAPPGCMRASSAPTTRRKFPREDRLA